MSLWGGGGRSEGEKERGPGREGLWGRDVGDQRERETETHIHTHTEREREVSANLSLSKMCAI